MVKLIEKILKLIFPPRCGVCDNIIELDNAKYVCPECYNAIKLIDLPVCKYCGKEFENITFGYCCSECSKHEKHYDMAICACEYSGIIKKLLQDFKFHNKIELCSVLSDILLKKITQRTDIPKFDIIISVPLHPNRLKQRGYNQSQLIAHYVGRQLGVICESDVIQKVKDTARQSELNRADRMLNVSGAFQVVSVEYVNGKNVLLIDDILTTGSTLRECSRELKNAGAKSVIVATVATGVTIKTDTIDS